MRALAVCPHCNHQEPSLHLYQWLSPPCQTCIAKWQHNPHAFGASVCHYAAITLPLRCHYAAITLQRLDVGSRRSTILHRTYKKEKPHFAAQDGTGTAPCC